MSCDITGDVLFSVAVDVKVSDFIKSHENKGIGFKMTLTFEQSNRKLPDDQMSAVPSEFIVAALGKKKTNRLESILSEVVIFGMNTGQWDHAALVQRAYQKISGPTALGPAVSQAYIALGYKAVEPAIDQLKCLESEIADDRKWALRAFIGLFMIFAGNDSYKQQARSTLGAVAEQQVDGNSQRMARDLLAQFFDQAARTIHNPRVPGLPM